MSSTLRYLPIIFLPVEVNGLILSLQYPKPSAIIEQATQKTPQNHSQLTNIPEFNINSNIMWPSRASGRVHKKPSINTGQSPSAFRVLTGVTAFGLWLYWVFRQCLSL